MIILPPSWRDSQLIIRQKDKIKGKQNNTKKKFVAFLCQDDFLRDNLKKKSFYNNESKYVFMENITEI